MKFYSVLTPAEVRRLKKGGPSRPIRLQNLTHALPVRTIKTAGMVVTTQQR